MSKKYNDESIQNEIEKYSMMMQFEHSLAVIIGLIGLLGVAFFPIAQELTNHTILYSVIVFVLANVGFFDLSFDNCLIAIRALKRRPKYKKLIKKMYADIEKQPLILYESDSELTQKSNIKKLYFKLI